MLLSIFESKVFAQTEERSLDVVLSVMQDRYGYQFNYADDTVRDITLEVPPEGLSFEQALSYLREKTKLVFHVLDNNFVSVRKPDIALQLCGYLKDKDSGEPLIYATVQGLQNSTVSDENGYFQLEVSSTSEMITLRYLGYKTLYRSYQFFKKDVCDSVYMIAETETLAQIVLSNYIVEGIDKLNDGSFQVDFSKFSLLPGLIEADVLHSMQAFPGIQSVNETVSNINIRGGSHDQNLILWDDIKMYQSGHFFGLISMFNPQITHKVSLRKNGTGVDFTDGVSGTISMKTNEAINPKLKGNIGVNLVSADGFVDAPIGKRSSVQVAARKALSDFIETPTYDEYFDRIAQDTEVASNVNTIINSDQKFDFYDASVRWIYEISDNDRIRLNFINTSNELVFDENRIIDTGEESRTSSVTQNSIAGGLYYKRRWNDDLITELQVYETDYKLKAINANLLESQRFLQENSVSETGARAKVNYRHNDNWSLLGGFQFIESKVTNLDDVDLPRFRSLIAEVVRTYSPFLQLEWRTEDGKTRISGGARYNYLDKFSKSIIEPRVQLNQDLGSGFGLELLGEFKHQVMSQIINLQNDFLGVEKRRWQLANETDIPVIESMQGSGALSFSDDGWLVSLEGYYKKVDGITTQSQGFQNQYEFTRTSGSYEVMGLDALLRKNFKNLDIWMSYSFMDNQYTFETLPEVTFPSNLDITHAITFGTTYVYRGLRVSGGFNWHSGRPTTLPTGQVLEEGDVIVYNPSNSTRLQEYFRVDGSALYEFDLGNVRGQAGVSVWNVLDTENTVSNYFRLDDTGVPVEFTQQSLGITPNAVVRIFF